MQEQFTMCPMNCHPTYCGMTATVTDAGDINLSPNRNHPESKGFLCQRGHSVQEIINHSARLLRPLQRNDRKGEWQPRNWDPLMDDLAKRLARPERVAIWMGHGAVVSDLNRPLLFHFAHTFGITVWDPAVVCWAAGAFGLAATGIVETNTKEDMAQHAECILLWGWNVVSQPTTGPYLMEAKKRGATLVAIDCRQSETAKIADEVLLIHPDTDAALALAMAHVLVRDGYVNRDFVEHWTTGYEEFAQSLHGYSPAWAAQVTGVPEPRIVELARQYATSSAAMILMGGSSLFKGQSGWLISRAIACLPALTGHVGKPGTGFGSRHRGFVQARNYSGFPGALPVAQHVSSHMEEIVRVLESGDIDTLFLFGTNFLSSFADAARVETALSHVECVVAHDLVLNQTMQRVADIALPATVWVEEVGLKATDMYVYLMDQIREPAGEARSVSAILSTLASRLHLPQAVPFASQEEGLNQMLQGIGPEVTVNALRANGGQWSRQAEPVGHARLVFHTPSQKIEFASDLLESLGLPRLPVPQLASAPPPESRELYPLDLRTGRSGLAFHSFYDEGKMLSKLHQREPEPVVWIHTQDAMDRNIVDGADVEVYNEKSAFRAKAFVSSRIVPGAIWVRDGWFGINQLTDGSSPLSVQASEGLLPITMPGAYKRIPGGQATYRAMVNVRMRLPL